MRYSGKIQAFTDFRKEVRDQNREAKIKSLLALNKPKVAPVLSQKQRENVVHQVQEALGAWTHSPFEREGSARAALRSAFCLGGNDWQASDQEAERITAAALSANGAKRPTWEEGQWTYAVSEDYCKWCQRPMELGHAGRYCSAECASLAMVHRDFGERVNGNRAFMDVYRTVQKFANPTKPCSYCEKPFHPRIEGGKEQEYCSRLCTTKAKNAAAMANPTPATCVVCRDEFFVKSLDKTRAKYCCTACQVTGYRMGKGVWDPKRLNKQVFEQLILGQGPVVALLTPARFDDLLEAA